MFVLKEKSRTGASKSFIIKREGKETVVNSPMKQRVDLKLIYWGQHTSVNEIELVEDGRE
jgi:hypothetical protein